jgi:hypothetical protein
VRVRIGGEREPRLYPRRHDDVGKPELVAVVEGRRPAQREQQHHRQGRGLGADTADPGLVMVAEYPIRPRALRQRRPEAARAEPGLTTIRQPLVEKGARVARRLLALLAGAPVDAAPELLVTELVVRGSTAPPPSQSRLISHA